MTRKCLDLVQATGSGPSDIQKYGTTSPKAAREYVEVGECLPDASVCKPLKN